MEEKKKTFRDDLEENLMGIFAAISLLLMLSTFVTQFFTSPESVAAVQQTSYYAYAWVVGFALSVCARDNIYLRVPVLEKHLPEGGKNVLYVLQNIIGTIVLITMLVIYFQATVQGYTDGTMDKKAPFIPIALAYTAMGVGFVFANVRNVMRLTKKGGK